MATNPNPYYPKRTLPVGVLSYDLEAHHLKYVNAFRHIAMLEFGEAELMYDIPRIIGGGHIANLGHAHGGSAILMAMCLREHALEGHIHSVDTFKGNGNDPTHSSAMKIIDQFNVTDQIVLHRGSTDDWAENLGGEEFDFLFIDADHSYRGVLRDLHNWAPLVKPNGLVGFHDTNQDFSNKVLEEEILDSPYWAECEELHVNRIRIFEKLV